MKRIAMAVVLLLPMVAQAREPVSPARWTQNYVPSLQDWQAALLYNGASVSAALGEEISRATAIEGLKLNKSGDTSINQTLTTPAISGGTSSNQALNAPTITGGTTAAQTLTDASVGAIKITQSGTSLPFLSSTGTQLGVMGCRWELQYFRISVHPL